MEIACLNEVRKIERCMKDIIDLVDTWRNLSAQLETTRKMPRYTSLMLHSSNWQPRLMAQIELEIDIIAGKLSEQWKQIEEAANMLNDFIAVDCQSQQTVPPPCHQELQYLLSYLVVEIMKWFEMQNKATCSTVIATMKPSFDVEKCIARCKQNLQATENNASKKSF
ncbi:unnamed protein product [Onchocerca ochengi]|uniref:DHC_N2 domain-containing protein n=1 Tax=Onchocerca ochengi TaxID=42157 RepID=A0A182E519_ONCOC|nr:unnamed protein product [Onchocerca ochengi]VDK67400.1 unnamed protein product [Onchocerca ochengi]VDK67940.1 unnamed protein product [Onchocerca ochengi]